MELVVLGRDQSQRVAVELENHRIVVVFYDIFALVVGKQEIVEFNHISDALVKAEFCANSLYLGFISSCAFCLQSKIEH